jgi:Asp-tRNA(Asn)/Glu-tRNA(Gln) amidotransferase A subunit family amidase
MDRTSSAEPPLITPAALESAQPVRALRGLTLPLDRIARIAPKLHCYITVCADLARTYAHQMDDELRAGHSRGPLHGIPYSLKDVFDTAGIPTTWGSTLYRDRTPTEDATPADPDGPRHTTTRNVTFHGRLFEEGKMLALAAALEKRLGVWDRQPIQ